MGCLIAELQIKHFSFQFHMVRLSTGFENKYRNYILYNKKNTRNIYDCPDNDVR